MRARFADKSPDLPSFPKARSRTSAQARSSAAPVQGDSAIFLENRLFRLPWTVVPEGLSRRGRSLRSRTCARDEPVRRNHEARRFADCVTRRKRWLALATGIFARSVMSPPARRRPGLAVNGHAPS